MDANLDAKKLSELADVLCNWAKALNDYRFEKKQEHQISEGDYNKIGVKVKQLLNAAEKMKVMSTLLVSKEVARSLEQIGKVSSEMAKTIRGLGSVQKIISLATGLAELGSAIIQKDASGIQEQVQELLVLWKNEV
ncbi:hypothetical protein [Negadavirga shengliensis]|uniref:Methyl-accepting chemotaxis protein n=1 Tax=Negadavirga shengliensis TaxID=1389218 RepID=A0ABV9T1Y4_9BACT